MMYYVVTYGEWVDGQGWSYKNEVLEEGKVRNINEIDIEGYIWEYLSCDYNYRPSNKDIQYTVSLYDSEEASYEGNPVDEYSVWESEVWKQYMTG